MALGDLYSIIYITFHSLHNFFMLVRTPRPDQKMMVKSMDNLTFLIPKHLIPVVVYLNSFWVMPALEHWLKYFFGLFSTFFVHFKRFPLIFQQKSRKKLNFGLHVFDLYKCF